MIAQSRARVADFIGGGDTLAVSTATIAPAVARGSERPGGLRLHDAALTERGAAIGESVGWPLVDSAGLRGHGASAVERTAARDVRDAARRRHGGERSPSGAFLRERGGRDDEAVADRSERADDRDEIADDRSECADRHDESADALAAFDDILEPIAVAVASSGGSTVRGGDILAWRGGLRASRVVSRLRGRDRGFGRAAMGGCRAATWALSAELPARPATGCMLPSMGYRSLFVAALGLCLSCGSASPAGPEGAAGPDGGADAGLLWNGNAGTSTGGADGGAPLDAGALGDAGSSADAGVQGGDAGSADAGPAVDAGGALDAGGPLDAGTSSGGGCAGGPTQSCTTSCGSSGTESCQGGSYGACLPPAEICNLKDDDCNGYCDDVMGCRVAVDRSYDSSTGLHFYTTTDSEASCCGYSVEAYGSFYLYAAAQPGLVPFYRCRTASGAHLYTQDQSCGGATLEGQLGFIATGAVCGSIPLYALHDAASGDDLYTTSQAEMTSAEQSGYAPIGGGTAGYVWPGACGGPGCSWPSPVELEGSALAAVTGFPTAWYGFPIPPGTQSLVSLSGTLSVTNAQSLYSELLFIVEQLPSGSCPAGRWPASTPEYGPPGALGLAQYIVKAPAQGTFSLAIDQTFPGGLPFSNCLLLGLNGGPVSTPQDVVSAAKLTLGYAGPQSPAQRAVGLGGEACFGQGWGCQGATTNDSLSFAAVSPISQATQLVALYGDISDSTFDGTASFGAPPAGAWTATNDFYVYHGSECSSFGVPSGFAGPGSYYAQIPADATRLLSVPLSGSGIGVQTVPVFQSFSGLKLAAGDCLVTLWGLSGGGGFDDETQVNALLVP